LLNNGKVIIRIWKLQEPLHEDGNLM